MGRQTFKINKAGSNLNIFAYSVKLNPKKFSVAKKAGFKFDRAETDNPVLTSIPNTLSFDSELLAELSDHYKLTFYKKTLIITDII